MSSIPDINEVPDLETLTHVSQSLAVLDAIMMPEWEYRYFSFNAAWNPDLNHQLASMRDGQGDELFLLFTPAGAAGKVLSKSEQIDDVETVLASVPDTIDGFKEEPAFMLCDMTFCFWRTRVDSSWSVSPGGRDNYPLLGYFMNDYRIYHSWAREYYEVEIDEAAVQKVFQDHELTRETIATLNPDVMLDTLKADIAEIFGRDYFI